MYRTHTCGALNTEHIGNTVKLCGWVQRVRRLGGMVFIDLRDRYGITQLAFNEALNSSLCKAASELTRESVICAEGLVIERERHNTQLVTGQIELQVRAFELINAAQTPPFTIEDDTDGGEELRMQYRYLDLRRNPLRQKIELRHRITIAVRNFMNQLGFLEIETPVLIKSTPEGARDFVVPSRMHSGQFYALPQSPQTFKQLLMVSGFDKYFQIVKCFRDEDLRADRQPEFTQIDCEMSFVTQDDIITTFESLVRHLFFTIKQIQLEPFIRMDYAKAMSLYGNDKPDMRFDMLIHDLKPYLCGKGFSIFDTSEYVSAICVSGAAAFTRKQLDELNDWVKRPQIGAHGLAYCRILEDASFKSSVDKFYNSSDWQNVATFMKAQAGDLILILAGPKEQTQKALSELRLEMGTRMGLRSNSTFSCLWVTDFPLLEWNSGDPNLPESYRGRWHAKHHPFTSPKSEDIPLLKTNPGDVRANAYDLVINGVEIGGGSIRIHDAALQKQMFETLGFSAEVAEQQFGFLMHAFTYGAPPHGGIAFGLDRLCALFSGSESIRDVIAFPKNNSGRDLMIEAPSIISAEQLNELDLKIKS